MSDELITLQSAVAFQEHGLAELADILTGQQKQLDHLRLELRMLQERVAYLEGALDSRGQGAPADERPPHY
ncbi:MAG TPA: SlyX family protein [Hyphomicrobiales bacterium]|nr:SlyX family protein [Hyphomicrobiales bacterium]